jgi:hypothetical protein
MSGRSYRAFRPHDERLDQRVGVNSSKDQGLTLVDFLAQRKRLLRDTLGHFSV